MRAIDLAGCPVGCADRSAFVAHLLGCIDRGERMGIPHHHVSMNASKWVSMRRDTALCEAVRGATSVAADGSAIVLASRLLGDPLPERVTGCDLAHDLLAVAAERGLRVALFGASPVIVAEVARRWRALGVEVAYARDGYAPESEHAAIAEAIAAVRPHLLLVAMGTPKSERFIARHLSVLRVPLSMGVGGCFDVMAGAVRRAPEILSRWHLEWAWRLCGAPRARFDRAVLDSARFVSAMARGERVAPTAPPTQ